MKKKNTLNKLLDSFTHPIISFSTPENTASKIHKPRIIISIDTQNTEFIYILILYQQNPKNSISVTNSNKIKDWSEKKHRIKAATEAGMYKTDCLQFYKNHVGDNLVSRIYELKKVLR